MPHYEIENLEPAPEEAELQQAKEQEVKNKEKEIVAKTVTKEAKIDKALETAQAPAESYNYKEHKEQPVAHTQSIFYPLAQGLNDYITRKVSIEPANESEREAIREATLALEQKYGADKIDSPEARFVVAEVTPFVRQFDKVLDYIRHSKQQPENKAVKHEEVVPAADANLPAGFKLNSVQAKKRG